MKFPMALPADGAAPAMVGRSLTLTDPNGTTSTVGTFALCQGEVDTNSR